MINLYWINLYWHLRLIQYPHLLEPDGKIDHTSGSVLAFQLVHAIILGCLGV